MKQFHGQLSRADSLHEELEACAACICLLAQKAAGLVGETEAEPGDEADCRVLVSGQRQMTWCGRWKTAHTMEIASQ